jgi:hypothetical protein
LWATYKSLPKPHVRPTVKPNDINEAIDSFIDPSGTKNNEEDEYESWKRSEPVALKGSPNANNAIKYWVGLQDRYPNERPRKRYHGGSESLTRTEIQKPARSDKRKRLDNDTEALDEEPAHKRLRGNTSSDQLEKADEQSQGDTEQHAQVEKRKRLDGDGEADNEDPAHKRPRGDTSADEVEDDDEQAQGDTDKPVQGKKRKRVADDVETDDDEPGHKRLCNDASADEVEEADEQTQGDVVLIEYKESTDKTAPEPCHDSPLEPIPEERRHQSPIVKRTRDGEDDDRAQEEEKDMNEEEPKRLHFLDDLREVDAKLERRDGYISISERAYGNKRRRINMYSAQVRDGEW